MSTYYYVQAKLTHGGHVQKTNKSEDRELTLKIFEAMQGREGLYREVELITVTKEVTRKWTAGEPPKETLPTYHKVGIGDYLYSDAWGLSHIVQMVPVMQTSIPPLHKMQLTLWSEDKEQEWAITADWGTIHEMRDKVLKNPDWSDKY